MSNSPLITYTRLSPNNSGERLYNITRITPHCVVGQCSIESLGSLFSDKDYRASSNYGIDANGRIGLFVDENNRSWCSSNADNDNRAITIECASGVVHPYAMTELVYNTLIDLCTDICSRHHKKKLLWFADKNKALSYNPFPDEMLITVHRWFANKACPGQWLYDRLPELASTVTQRLHPIIYRVQIGAFRDKSNAENLLTQLHNSGFTQAFITSHSP